MKGLELKGNGNICSGLQCYKILNIMMTKEYKKEVYLGKIILFEGLRNLGRIINEYY
ncbi:hypothetical protein AM1_5877 [Acaryochloris marina MBIC11017]|uniref:Uncharacterized protein n=1 Tax=Acaryochloris marina (strain MBIC 11017) TaxID=329726 RepID=B0C0M5_ACAM1|nr:hypothetical protein AM1_5877 [Acaryochloris marina MBIC11017]